VAFSPDDNFIASGSEDKSVKVWSVSNGKEINSFTGHSGGIYAIAYSPNGKYIASAGEATSPLSYGILRRERKLRLLQWRAAG
jgi:WD40 repeat protein